MLIEPPEANLAVTPPAAGAPGAKTLEQHQAFVDWSSLMTEVELSLTRAEDELRLLHMDLRHRSLAKGHLMVARHTLLQLEKWCES